MIMSPLGYMASVIPGLKGLSTKYWDTLLGQAYFAPLFMILSLITLTLTNGLLQPPLNNSSTSLATAFLHPSIDTIGLIINFFLLIGMMIATLTISKQYATQGGIVSGKMVSAGTGLLGGAVFGGAALAGRRFVGGYASEVSKDKDLQKRADAGEVGARTKLWLANKTAAGSFDFRRSALGRKLRA